MNLLFKNFILLFIVLLMGNTVFASSIKILAETQEDFSTKHPRHKLTVKIINDYELPNGEYIMSGTILKGTIVDIREPKRGKLNAYFKYKVENYYLPDSDTAIKVKRENLIAKGISYTPKDMTDTVLSTGTSVANMFVKNIAYPINFAKGVIDPEDASENRVVSGIKSTYEGSMFSYISKGKDIEINEGDKLILIFYSKNADEE